MWASAASLLQCFVCRFGWRVSDGQRSNRSSIITKFSLHEESHMRGDSKPSECTRVCVMTRRHGVAASAALVLVVALFVGVGAAPLSGQVRVAAIVCGRGCAAVTHQVSPVWGQGWTVRWLALSVFHGYVIK